MTEWALNSFPNLRLLVIKSRELVRDIVTPVSGEDIVDATSGVVEAGSDWFTRKVNEKNRSTVPRHPLQAPLVYSPCDATQPICRYHNYHPKGCSKESRCPYDHEHCHRCLLKGHTAKTCAKDAYEQLTKDESWRPAGLDCLQRMHMQTLLSKDRGSKLFQEGRINGVHLYFSTYQYCMYTVYI